VYTTTATRERTEDEAGRVDIIVPLIFNKNRKKERKKERCVLKKIKEEVLFYRIRRLTF
jgi:hypothetical protein